MCRVTVCPSLASATATVPFTTTAWAEGEAADVVLPGVGAGVPFGVTVVLTVDGLGDGDAPVGVGFGEAVTVTDGLPGEVAVGLVLVDVTGFEEHALSSIAPQRPTTGHTRRRGQSGRRRSSLLRPDQAIAFLPCGARVVHTAAW
jgi:hypothetical protein